MKLDRLALGAVIATLLMIVIGAITRVTDSGMGCGTHWPLCNGHIVPEFGSMAVVIEYGHRLFALLVGVFSVGVLVQAWRQHRDEQRILYPAAAAFVLYFVQSGLGAVTVILSNQWVSVLLHLGNSMFLLAAFLILWVNARQLGEGKGPTNLPLFELLLATTFSFLVAMLGAAVAGNNAAKACVGWPLCAGQIWPAEQGPLQLLNMLHRLAAGSLGIVLIVLIVQAMRRGTNRTLRRAVGIGFGIYLLQAALGALVVLIYTPELLGTVRALHVLFAASTWSMMIVASSIGWLQQQSVRVTTSQSGRIPAPSATTSN